MKTLTITLHGRHALAVRECTLEGESFASCVRRMIDQVCEVKESESRAPVHPDTMTWLGVISCDVDPLRGVVHLRSIDDDEPVDVPFLGVCS